MNSFSLLNDNEICRYRQKYVKTAKINVYLFLTIMNTLSIISSLFVFYTI
jgi:intergrase/recombinase